MESQAPRLKYSQTENQEVVTSNGKTSKTLESTSTRAVRGKTLIECITERVSEKRTTEADRKEDKKQARTKELQHFQVQGCRFDKYLGFLFFFLKKEEPLKSLLSCLD